MKLKKNIPFKTKGNNINHSSFFFVLFTVLYLKSVAISLVCKLKVNFNDSYMGENAGKNLGKTSGT